MMAAALGLDNEVLDFTHNAFQGSMMSLPGFRYRKGSNEFMKCIEKRGMRPSLAVASGLHPSSLI